MKRTPRGTEDDAGGQDAAAPPASTESDSFDAMADALAQLGEDVRGYILVEKVGTEGNVQDWAYCGRYGVGHFDIEAIRARHGAGRFRARFVRSNGKTFRTVHFLVAPCVASLGPPAAAASPATEDRSLLTQLILKGQEQTTAILTAMIGAFGGRGSGGVDGADLIAAVKEGREGASGGNNTLEAIRLGMELSGRGGGVEQDPLVALAGPAMNLLSQALNRTAPARAAAPAALPAGAPAVPSARPQRMLAEPATTHRVEPGGTSPAGAEAPPLTPPAPTSTLDAPPELAGFIGLAQAWLPTMLKEAASGRDGYTWGRYTAERVKGAFHPHLLMLADATPAERMALLTQLEPRFAAYADWLDAAAAGIHDELLGEKEDEDLEDEDVDAGTSERPADGPAVGRGGRNGDGAHDGGAHPAAGEPAAGESRSGAN